MPQRPNRILSLLEQAAPGAMRPYLDLVLLPPGQTLSLPNKPIRHAYFPIEGMISLVQTFSDGDTVEVGLIGAEGFWGAPLILGVRSTPLEAMVQAACLAYRIAAKDLQNAITNAPVLGTFLLRYTEFLHIQSAVIAACNARHPVARRLARWLLEARDQIGKDKLPLSHEFLSYMLGVRRAGVTDALTALSRRNLVRTGRGSVELYDRPALEEACCECYRLLQGQYRRLFPSDSIRAAA